jgi:3-oxoacyl-[acyl-carrier protein] reductase
MSLENKVVIITGAARGIGEATALAFAKEGAKVVVTDMGLDTVKAVVDQITALGFEALGFEVNVTDRQAVNSMMDEVYDRWGSVDVLINNAGITADAQLLKLEEDAFDRVIDVNLKGTFNCGQKAAQLMAENGGGVILNASSVVGLYGNFGQTNYAATKWGVIGMTKTWAKELGKKGIRVNAVAPGFTMTPMVAKMPEKVLDMMKAKSPLGTLATPEDIANAYVFLASDKARFITGTVLSVDGGVVL